MSANVINIPLIAEVKTFSPFGYKSKESWEELLELASGVGNIISIHTSEEFHGSPDLIKRARKTQSLPILAKGRHESDEDIKRAIEAGADYVLVVGRIPGVYRERCWIEPLTLKELEQIPDNYDIVWNSRDLSNGKLKSETFEQVREMRKGWLCQASNIRSKDDVKEGADAILVGQHLREFVKSVGYEI